MRPQIVGLGLILCGCASGYSQFYQAVPTATPEVIALVRAAPPPKTPALAHAGGSGQDVVAAYIRKGYALIGYSSFNTGHRESDDMAVPQGEKVGADLVVVLDPKYTGSVTTSIPITTPTTSTSYTNGTATAYGPAGTATAYGTSTTTTYGSETTYIPMTIHRFDYGALYFVMRHIILGANTRDLTDDERRALQTNRGVFVASVVEGSPALRADILPGDIINAVDGHDVYSARELFDLTRQKRGQDVAITISRDGQTISKSVRLAE